MAVTGPIPLPESGMDAFLQELQRGALNRQNAQKMEQERLANEQLNKYRQAHQSLEEQKFGLEQQLQPQKLDLLREKILALKRGGGNTLTKPMMTYHQKTIQNIDNILPQIDQLITPDTPGQFIGKYLNPSNQATYEGKTSKMIESLMGALNLPKTNQSLKKVTDMVTEKPFESRENYKKRIADLKADLIDRKRRSRMALQGNTGSDEDLMSDEEMPSAGGEEAEEMQDQIPSGNESNIEQGLVTVIDPSGKEHKIYRDKLDAAKKKYPGLKVKRESFSAAKI